MTSSAAHDRRLAIHDSRARRGRSSCRRFPRFPHAGIQEQRRRARARRHRGDHELSVRAPQVGPGRGQARLERRPPPDAGTRDTQLVMLAALCQQIKAWRQAEKKSRASARARSISRSASSTPIRRSRRRTWRELLRANQPAGGADLLGASPGRGPRCA